MPGDGRAALNVERIAVAGLRADSVQADITEGRLAQKPDATGGLLMSFVDLDNAALDQLSGECLRLGQTAFRHDRRNGGVHPLGQLGTTDDCGFLPSYDDVTTSRDTAFAKIKARVDGTRLAELRLFS